MVLLHINFPLNFYIYTKNKGNIETCLNTISLVPEILILDVNYSSILVSKIVNTGTKCKTKLIEKKTYYS